MARDDPRPTTAMRAEVATEPDHAACGPDPAILAAIASAAVNLAVWERRLGPELAAALAGADLAGLDPFDTVGTPAEVGEAIAALAGSALPSALAMLLAADAADLAARFATVLTVERVGLRLERITGNACKRFHADYMRARLITTYRGAGTEWLCPRDAARVVDGQPPEAAVISRLPTAAVAVMKGRLWSPDRPLVHRSPPIAGSGCDRLVLVVDAADCP